MWSDRGAHRIAGGCTEGPNLVPKARQISDVQGPPPNGLVGLIHFAYAQFVGSLYGILVVSTDGKTRSDGCQIEQIHHIVDLIQVFALGNLSKQCLGRRAVSTRLFAQCLIGSPGGANCGNLTNLTGGKALAFCLDHGFDVAPQLSRTSLHHHPAADASQAQLRTNGANVGFDLGEKHGKGSANSPAPAIAIGLDHRTACLGHIAKDQIDAEPGLKGVVKSIVARCPSLQWVKLDIVEHVAHFPVDNGVDGRGKANSCVESKLWIVFDRLTDGVRSGYTQALAGGIVQASSGLEHQAKAIGWERGKVGAHQPSVVLVGEFRFEISLVEGGIGDVSVVLGTKLDVFESSCQPEADGNVAFLVVKAFQIVIGQVVA